MDIRDITHLNNIAKRYLVRFKKFNSSPSEARRRVAVKNRVEKMSQFDSRSAWKRFIYLNIF